MGVVGGTFAVTREVPEPPRWQHLALQQVGGSPQHFVALLRPYMNGEPVTSMLVRIAASPASDLFGNPTDQFQWRVECGFSDLSACITKEGVHCLDVAEVMVRTMLLDVCPPLTGGAALRVASQAVAFVTALDGNLTRMRIVARFD